MVAYVNRCRFNPTLGGTTDWTYSSAVTGYNSPALAGIVNAKVYSYSAESADLSQWEEGTGAYNTSTGVLARTTVLYNSSGSGTASGQSGAGTKISFSTAPQVSIVALAQELPSLTEANTFTGTITATGYFSGATLPSYTLTNAAGSTTYGKILHDGTDLFLQQSLAGSIFATINGATVGRFQTGSFTINGATSGVWIFQPPAVAGTQTITSGQFPGTTTNDTANAGNVGEYVESVIAVAGKTAFTSGAAKTITSISLTAGDWDVDVLGYVLPAATTSSTLVLMCISLVNNTLDVTAGRFASLNLLAGTFTANNEISLAVPPYRVSLASTTTIYMVARADFTVSTSAGYGIIRARRVR